MNSDRTLITTGVIGGVVTAVCCATPLLAVVLGAAGLAAWLAKADYVLIPALLICLALVELGLTAVARQPKRAATPKLPNKAPNHERLLRAKEYEQGL